MTKLASHATAAVLLAATLSAAPLVASAQEAIRLETLGAVRMVSPEELRQRIAEPARAAEARAVHAASAETILVDRQTAAR